MEVEEADEEGKGVGEMDDCPFESFLDEVDDEDSRHVVIEGVVEGSFWFDCE